MWNEGVLGSGIRSVLIQPSALRGNILERSRNDKVCAAGPTGADRPAGTVPGAYAEHGEYGVAARRYGCMGRSGQDDRSAAAPSGAGWMGFGDPVMLRSDSCGDELGASMCALMNSPTGVPAFDGKDGLVTAVVQDAATGEVLMVAHMNREAWDEMLASGRAVYFSRARGRLWRKGEESGNIQLVREIYVDCDADALLLKVEQKGGAACHEGYKSCFFRQVTPEGVKVISERVFDPAKVYGRSE